MTEEKVIFEKNHGIEEKENLRDKLKEFANYKKEKEKKDKKRSFLAKLFITAWIGNFVVWVAYLIKNEGVYKLKINEPSSYQEKINNFKEEIKNDIIKRCLEDLKELNKCNLEIKMVTEIRRNCSLDDKKPIPEKRVRVFSEKVKLMNNKKALDLNELISEVAEIAEKITKVQEQLIDEEIKAKEDSCKKEIKVKAIVKDQKAYPVVYISP
jgi:hypothetical protein